MAYTTTRTFYDVLELNKSASRNEVKDAYKKMALKRHPDKNPEDKRAVAKFQEVQEAYETLYDNGKRMDYNIKIGSNKSLPPGPALFTGAASSWATATPCHAPPAFKRPDWFWSGVHQPKRSYRPPKPTDSKEDRKIWEDWSRPYEEPNQDEYEEWQKEEEQRKKDFDNLTAHKEKDWYEERLKQQEQRKKHREELKACNIEEQRRQADAKIPSTLTVTLRAILRLSAWIDEMEAENKAADIVIEEWVGMNEKEGEFFDEVYQRNIMLHSLRRDHESEMKTYRKLYKRLKTFDAKQSAEAELIYRRLKKQRAKGQRSGGSNSQELDDQGQKVKEQQRRQHHEEEKTAKEEYRRKAEERVKANEEYRRQAEERRKANEEHRYQEVKERNEAMRRAQEEEQMGKEKSSLPENTSMHDGKTTSESVAEIEDLPDHQVYEGDKSDLNGADAEYESDDEVILILSRRIHAQHAEVNAEFWEIAEELHVCCFCSNVLTVFECPKYEQCKLRACEGCRISPRNR